METLIPLQFAEPQPTGFGAGKVIPCGEVLLDLPLEGLLPAVPLSFSDFVKSLSGSQNAAVKEKPVLSVLPAVTSDFPEAEPVVDARAGIYQLSLLQQVHEMSVGPGGHLKDTELLQDEGVPQPDASYGDRLPGDTTGRIDPETAAGKTLPSVIGTGDPVDLMAPDQSRPLSMDSAREDTPIRHVSKETGTDSPSRPVQIDPDGISGNISGFQGLETAGGGFFSPSLGPPSPEGTPIVPGTAEDSGEPEPVTAGRDNAVRLTEGHVLSAGMDSKVSQTVSMILPFLENEKGSQTDVRGRVSLALPGTSEKISTQGSLSPIGQDVSGNFPEGPDRGGAVPFHGVKAGMPDSRFEPVIVHGDTSVSTVKPESTVPGAFQKSDPEKYIQVEKMTWSLTGPPGTGVSEKGDIMEAVRLPLEPREIRTLTDIIEKTVWRLENGQSQARIQLKPAFLGHLHVNVMTDQLKVTVEIRAETQLARDFLETKLHVLKADLQESGLEIDKINVLVDPDLNKQQEQGYTGTHKQTHRLKRQLEEVNTPADADPAKARKKILSGREENLINCFV